MMLTVFCRTTFIGFHRWKDAPTNCGLDFLREWHRHIFHVELELEVTHDNRDLEFTNIKVGLDKTLQANYGGQYFEFSCEQIATQIAQIYIAGGFKVKFVEVSEDGENGGRWYNEQA